MASLISFIFTEIVATLVLNKIMRYSYRYYISSSILIKGKALTHSLTDWLITNSPTSPVDKSLKFGRLMPYSLSTKVKHVSFQKTNRYHLKKNKKISICKYIQLKAVIKKTHKFFTPIAHHLIIVSLIMFLCLEFFSSALYCWN